MKILKYGHISIVLQIDPICQGRTSVLNDIHHNINHEQSKASKTYSINNEQPNWSCT